MFCKNCGQQIVGAVSFCSNCGQEIKTNRLIMLRDRLFLFFKSNKKAVIIISIVVALFILIIFTSEIPTDNNQNLNQFDNTVQQSSSQGNYSQDSVPSSVVNVFCDNDEGGSGTIRTKDGLILTNNHVVAGSSFCLVALADKTTGQLMEIYKAEPIIVPSLSKEYDLAGLAVYNSFTDENGKTWGVYPKVFPFFSAPSICDNYSPSLGEGITIYGYPVTSGGYNLTVTDGIISSFADDGTILTSAKIDSGNSGGLAINRNGCFVGIPSAVVNGNYQNLGVIIPQTLIDEFLSQVLSN